MKVSRDDRPEAFQRLEHLLYGFNYQVWVNVYGPLDSSQPLVDALENAISPRSVVANITTTSIAEVQKDVIELLLYSGEPGIGPIELDVKREEITRLANEMMQLAHVDEADQISAFRYVKGHPGYPVFWEFAYDVHAQGKRWILLGCSSD